MDYYFAPLEGITDEIYRSVHHEYFGGISKYFIPFISPTNQSTFNNRELRNVARSSASGFTCIPQVLTKDADAFVRTCKMLEDMGYNEVNLNLGCPSGTVTGKGKGSAMLRDPDSLRLFFDDVFASVTVKVSVKTRIGFDDTSKWAELTDLLTAYPFCEVIIHPRTRKEFYKGAVHTDAYADFYNKNTGLPVFNGDLFTPNDIHEIMERFPETHAVMLGRGLVAAPFMAEGSFNLKKVKDFHDALLKAYSDERPVNAVLGHMSEIMLYMSMCFEGSKKCLKEMQKSRRLDDYTNAVNRMFETCPVKAEPYFSVLPGANSF